MINKPPNIIKLDKDKTTIFLAGSIEIGTAEKWQDIVESKLSTNYNIINPRRDDWDSSWTQDYDNPQFYQQVSWELNGLELADEILFYFDPNTKSPITLLELGLFARFNKCSVICPKGFWRKGNVDIVCNRYHVIMYNTLEDYLNEKVNNMRIIGFSQ